MNLNTTMAARVAPAMMNDIVPPYADALPRFAKQRAASAPTSQVAYTQTSPLNTGSPSPVNPMFAPAPQAPVTEPQPQIHTEVVQQPTSPLAQELPAEPVTEHVPVEAHPDQANTPAQALFSTPKPKSNWIVITTSVLIAAGLLGVAFMSFKQNS